MIAYGYEQPVVITPTEIFNPTTANMVLLSMGQYSNALREDYKDTRNEWKDFMNKYGDFYSTINGANEAYYNAGIGGAMKKIANWEQEHGVPAIRSVEGRAVILRAIMEANTKDMNTIRQSAKVKEAYDREYAKLTPEEKAYEDWRLQQLHMDPTRWDHSVLWNRYSPEKYENVTSYWSDKVKSIPKSNTMYDAKGNVTTDPSKAVRHVEGVSEDRADTFMETMFPAYEQSPNYIYTRDRLAQQIKQNSPSYMSDDEANAAARQQIYDQVKNMAMYSSAPKADDIWMHKDTQSFQDSQRRKSEQFQKTMYETKRRDALNDAKNKPTSYNPFRDADTVANNKQNNYSGSFVNYVTNDSPHLKIAPANVGITYNRDSKGSVYSMSVNVAQQSLRDINGKLFVNNDEKTKTVNFIPTGQLENRDGRYYIYGTISGGEDLYRMEVKEESSNYGQKGNR